MLTVGGAGALDSLTTNDRAYINSAIDNLGVTEVTICTAKPNV